MKKTLTAVALFGALAFSTSASAAPITDWDYNVSSSMTNIDYNYWYSTQPGPETSITSGGSLILGSNATTISVADANGVYDTTTSVTSHGFTLDNGTNSSRPIVTDFDINLDLGLSPTGSSDVISGLNMFTFGALLATTPNKLFNSWCGFTSVSRCDDIVVLTGGDFGFFTGDSYTQEQVFSYDGFNYSATLGFTGVSALLDDVCDAAGVGNGCFGFTTEEKSSNSIGGFLNITNLGPNSQVSVPEPGTLALFALGLVGLGASRMRKSEKTV